MWDVIKTYIKDEAQYAVHGLFKSEYNFFKHADRDGDDLNKYYTPELTEFFLWQCCADFHLLFEEKYIETTIFELWFISRHSDFILDEYRDRHVKLRDAFGGIYEKDGSMSRSAVATLLRTLDEKPDHKYPFPVLAQHGAKPPL